MTGELPGVRVGASWGATRPIHSETEVCNEPPEPPLHRPATGSKASHLQRGSNEALAGPDHSVQPAVGSRSVAVPPASLREGEPPRRAFGDRARAGNDNRFAALLSGASSLRLPGNDWLANVEDSTEPWFS